MAEDFEDKIISAAMRLFADEPYNRVSLLEIAVEAGEPLEKVAHAYPHKAGVIAAAIRRIDSRSVEGVTADPVEGPRDRLFEILMNRFEAAQPYRDGFRNLFRSARDPMLAMGSLCRFGFSMATTLEAAGLSATGPLGFARIKALSAAYLYVLRAWFEDDSADLSKTMAALDRALDRLEGLGPLFPFGGRGSDAAPRAEGNADDATAPV